MALRWGIGLSLLAFVGLPVLSIALSILTMSGWPEQQIWLTTLSIYGSVFSFGWWLGFGDYRKSLFLGLTGCLTLALGLPAVLNALTKAQISGEKIADETDVPSLPVSPKIIAILTPHDKYGSKTYAETACTLFCQRLLYGGHRTAVLMGEAPASGRPDNATQLVRYSVEYRDSCPPVDLPLASTLSNEAAPWGSHTTSDRVSNLIANGHCLIAEPGYISEAEVAGVWSTSDEETRQTTRQETGAIAFGREELFVKQGGIWKSLARHTQSESSVVSTPFHLRGFVSNFAIARKERRPPEDGSELSKDIFMNAMRAWMQRPV